jgi:nucleoside-diphosphate-sugar epimerase
MKVLVTGCNGFAGRHALAALRHAGHEAIGGDLAASAGDGSSLNWTSAICPPARALNVVRPDAVLHRGGIAYVPLAGPSPARLFRQHHRT